MKIVIVFWGSLMILFSSCSSTYIIKHSQSDYAELNEELQGEECDMIVNRNENITARNIGIFRDSLYCIESNSDTEMVFHTSVIDKIIITENTTGALEGWAIGTLIGLGAFGIIYLNNPKPKTSTEKGLTNLMLVGIAGNGSLWGLVIGAIIGHDDIYIFETSLDSTKLK